MWRAQRGLEAVAAVAALSIAVGCVATAGPPTEKPAAAKALTPPLRAKILVDACVCAAAQAASALDAALARVAGDPAREVPRAGLAGCAYQATGVPLAIPPPIAPGSDAGRTLDEAVSDILLASQACHGTALVIAMSAAASARSESAKSAVETAANAARRTDAMAGAAIGVLAAFSIQAEAASLLAGRARSADFSGSFASDADTVWARARALVAARGSKSEVVRDLNRRPKPITVGSPATAAEFIDLRPPTESTRAALDAVLGLDLGGAARTGAALALDDGTAAHGVNAIRSLRARDFRSALRAARELAPSYTDAGRIVSDATALVARGVRPKDRASGKRAAPPTVRLDTLTPEDHDTLENRGLVTRPSRFRHEGAKHVGGHSFILVRGTPASVLESVYSTEAALRWMPVTESATQVAGSGRELWVEFKQGVDPVFKTYTVRVWRDDWTIRWELDQSRPHGIPDTWGFMAVRAWDPERTLVTVGVAIDLGDGILRAMFEDRIQRTVLSTPEDMRDYVEGRLPPGPTP